MLENKPDILPIGEVASILNVSQMTLRRWDKKGILTAFRPTEKNHRRYHKKDIIAHLNSKPKSKSAK